MAAYRFYFMDHFFNDRLYNYGFSLYKILGGKEMVNGEYGKIYDEIGIATFKAQIEGREELPIKVEDAIKLFAFIETLKNQIKE